MTEAPDLVGLFVVPFNELGIPYMVTGAVAAVVYGEPRFTRDLDVVLSMRRDDAARFAAAFPSDAFYVPPVEVIMQEVSRPRHGHFNLIHHVTALKADCYPVGDDPLHTWGMDRRVRQQVGDVPVSIAPIEYVILRKLEWHRDGGGERHLDDIRAMLRVNGDAMNQGELASWIQHLGLDAEWRLVGT